MKRHVDEDLQRAEFRECNMSNTRLIGVVMQDAVIDGETGFLTRPDDPDDMGEKLAYLLQNPDLVRAMGERARRHVTQVFDRERLIEALVEGWQATAALRRM